MAQILLWEAVAVASFAASAALVFAIVSVTEHFDANVGAHGAGGTQRAMGARRLLRRSEPTWWPEFERAFADYVRGGDGRGP